MQIYTYSSSTEDIRYDKKSYTNISKRTGALIFMTVSAV